VIVNPAGSPTSATLSLVHNRHPRLCAGDKRQDQLRAASGGAYRLSKNSVIRGGYGIYTARLDAGYILSPGNAISSVGPNGYGTYNPFQLINPQLGSTGPFSITQTYLNVVNAGAPPLLQFPIPTPQAPRWLLFPPRRSMGIPGSRAWE